MRLLFALIAAVSGSLGHLHEGGHHAFMDLFEHRHETGYASSELEHRCIHDQVVRGLREEEAASGLPSDHAAHFTLNGLTPPDYEELYVDGKHKLRSSSRKLAATEPASIRIEPEYQLEGLALDKTNLIKNSIMPRAIAILERAIKVKSPVVGNLKLPWKCKSAFMVTDPQLLAPVPDPTRCTEIVPLGKCLGAVEEEGFFGPYILYDKTTGDAQAPQGGGPGVAGTDTIVYVTALQTPSDTVTCSASTIAVGRHCSVDVDTGRPLAITINFCPEMLSTAPQDLGVLVDTAVHEMLHGLFFSETLYPRYRSPRNIEWDKETGIYLLVTSVGEVSAAEHPTGVGYKAVLTPKVREAMRTYTGCTYTDPAKDRFLVGYLENDGGEGTAVNHWETRFFRGELMTGMVGSKQRQEMSAMTFALMEDSGWYLPGYTAPHLTVGQGKGCGFIEDKCNVNAISTTLTDAGFCALGTPQGTYRCGHDRTYLTLCGGNGLTQGCQMANPVQNAAGIPVTCTDPSFNTVELTYWRGQRFGPNSRCLEYQGTFSRRDIPTDNVGPGCFIMECNAARSAVTVEVLGQKVACPAGQFIDLSTITLPGLDMAYEKLSGHIGPCPTPASVCPGLTCPNDCTGRGTCVQGACVCNLGFTGPDCTAVVCTPEAGMTNSCPDHQICNFNTRICENKAGVVAPPPSPPYFTPGAPPAAPTLFSGVTVPSPLRQCVVFGDVDGSYRVQYWDHFDSTKQFGTFSVRAVSTNPVVSIDPFPGSSMFSFFGCRDQITGQRHQHRYMNVRGGRILSPLSTMHALVKLRIGGTDEDIRTQLQQCLSLPLTENILDMPEGRDPLRATALTISTNVTDATKMHYFLNVALQTAQYILGLNAASSLLPLRPSATVDQVQSAKMQGADAVLGGIALRCLEGKKTFNATLSEHWAEAMDYGINVYLGVQPGAFYQKAGDVVGCECISTPCYCDANKVAAVSALVADINLLTYQEVFRRGAFGVDIASSIGKIQYIVQSAYVPLTEGLTIYNSIRLDAHKAQTSTAGSTSDFATRFKANNTYGLQTVLNVLGSDTSIVFSPPPPPGGAGGDGDGIIKAGSNTNGGVIAAYILVFTFGLGGAIGLGTWYLRWSNKKAASEALGTDRIVGGPEIDPERRNLLMIEPSMTAGHATTSVPAGAVAGEIRNRGLAPSAGSKLLTKIVPGRKPRPASITQPEDVNIHIEIESMMPPTSPGGQVVEVFDNPSFDPNRGASDEDTLLGGAGPSSTATARHQVRFDTGPEITSRPMTDQMMFSPPRPLNLPPNVDPLNSFGAPAAFGAPSEAGTEITLNPMLQKGLNKDK